MKKRIIPAKYFVLVTILSLFGIPILFSPLVVGFTLSLDRLPYELFCVFILCGFGMEYGCLWLYEENSCIIIENGTIANYIGDTTNNAGWVESISNVKSVKLVGKEEVQKYFKQYKQGKAILIDFGNYNVKYIWAGLLSKKQIDQIIEILTQK